VMSLDGDRQELTADRRCAAPFRGITKQELN
jgi:hypothetical protein